MISRRQFVKRLLATVFALTGAGALLSQTLKNRDTKETGVEPSIQKDIPSAPVQQNTVVPSDKRLLLSFFLLSDVHISDNGTSAITNKLHSALKDITHFESPVDTIVFGGDIT